jgi:hypothetical protein
MTKFTGYARSRGFQNIPARDKSRQIQQRSDSVLRDMEAKRQRNLQVANQHLQDLRDKHELERQNRQLNESIRREYASSYIEAYQRNADAQVKGQLRAIEQRQGFVKNLLDFSQTLVGVAQEQNQKYEQNQLDQANVLASRFGLTAQQFQDLQTLKGVLDRNERETAPVYEAMLRRGATAEDLNTLINASGYSKYAFSAASMRQSGEALERYISENADTTIKGFSTSLNAAEQKGLPEYNDILLRMQQDFVVSELAGFDPTFIAEHAKPSMDRTLARRQDYARTIRNKENAKIYDANVQQEFATLAETGGAAAVMERLQDLTGPDKRQFKGIVSRYIPYLTELAEQGSLPDHFVTDLANQPLQIGNQQQNFGSLHSAAIDRLRIAEAEGMAEERKAIQAEYQLSRTQTQEVVRTVERDMSEKARSGALQYQDVVATIQDMQSRRDIFEDEDISKIKAFLPKTPDATAAENTIRQWDLSFKRDRQLPSIPEISASPLLPEQKLKWYDKVNKEIDAGLDTDQKSRRDLFLKSSLMRELNLADATMDQWGMVHPSVHNLYFRLQQDYDDLFSSDLTQNTNTRHEQAQAAILSRLPAGGSDKPLFTFDGDGFEGKVESLALPESSPSELTTSKIDNMLKDGNENRLYTQQIVPTSILDNYLDDLSSGKRVQMPELVSYISRKLGVSQMLVLEAQMDLATASDQKERSLNLPESADEFYGFVKGTPNSAVSKYVQSRYHSRNRASRALVASDIVDVYSATTEPLVLGAALLHENGITDRDTMITFLAIMLAESAADPNARGDYQLPDGTIVPKGTPGAIPQSFGWYQHHMSTAPTWNDIGSKRRAEYTKLLNMDREFRNEDLLDPVISTKLAVLLYQQRGQTFGDWSTYNNGLYKGEKGIFIQRAAEAVDRWAADQQKSSWNRSSTFTDEARQLMGVN